MSIIINKLRPHHVVCMSKLCTAISVFSNDPESYYNCIKEELKANFSLREDILDMAAINWGTIYGGEVMKILVKIISDDKFVLYQNSCDCVCSKCDGNTNGKCIGEEKIQIMDSIASSIINIEKNTLTKISDIQPNEKFDKVCELCGTKEKCNLIRKAVNYNY